MSRTDSPPRRPNVLWILLEDASPRFGCYGDDLARSPNVDRIAGDLPPRPANFERIVAANLGTESMEDEEAFEAELGPNNCAVE